MIKLLRNREVRLYFGVLGGVGVAGVLLCAWLFGWMPALVAGGMFGLLLGCSAVFTHRRYCDIAALAHTLSQISAGNYGVDLRKYTEGELSILYDELHKVTRTLSHQTEQLRADKRWLADALADISHQLKTPLTSISLMADLLLSPGLPPEKQEVFLGAIRTGTDRIHWLVRSLLKLSRLDAGTVVFEQEAVPVAAVVNAALLPLMIPIELKEQTLRWELDEAVLVGDLPWLAEAVGNLIKNCVEYTPKGGTIGIRCRDNPLYTTLEIWDDGPGIADGDIPHLFERFYRGQNASADSVGIGLALSKNIVNRHGGSIEAVQREGQGALFRLKFYKTVV